MRTHILAVVTVTLGSFSLAAGSSSARGPQDGAADKGGRSSSVAAGCAPAVSRGGQYFTFAEKFNRYYTDCAWQPSSTVYVSPDGKGDGSSRTAPTSVARALSGVGPGRMVVFLPGTYAGCFHLDADHGGTYDQPVVLRGERQPDGAPGAKVNCCG